MDQLFHKLRQHGVAAEDIPAGGVAQRSWRRQLVWGADRWARVRKLGGLAKELAQKGDASLIKACAVS